MFLKGSSKILDAALSNKNFAFAVLNEFLEVMGDSLRGTEVFHVLGDFATHFFAHPKEMIDAVFAGHDDSLKLIRADAVLSKLLFSNGLDMVEWPPVNMDTVFFLNVVVR